MRLVQRQKSEANPQRHLIPRLQTHNSIFDFPVHRQHTKANAAQQSSIASTMPQFCRLFKCTIFRQYYYTNYWSILVQCLLYLTFYLDGWVLLWALLLSSRAWQTLEARLFPKSNCIVLACVLSIIILTLQTYSIALQLLLLRIHSTSSTCTSFSLSHFSQSLLWRVCLWWHWWTTLWVYSRPNSFRTASPASKPVFPYKLVLKYMYSISPV